MNGCLFFVSVLAVTVIVMLNAARSGELGSQLKTVRSQAESAKQELVDYRDKATRILQVSPLVRVIIRLHCSAGWPICGSVGQSDTIVSPVKAAEPVKIPCGIWTWVAQRNHVLDGGQDPPTHAGASLSTKRGRPGTCCHMPSG